MSYFLSEVPGTNQARVVNPSGLVAPDGSAVMVLGDNVPGFKRRMNPGDGMAVAQTPDVEEGKLVRFTGRARGPREAPPAVTANLEPYALIDGQTLTLAFDVGAAQVVTFDTLDFVDIANATAREVADAINAQIEGGSAAVTGDGAVAIRTARRGRRARARVVAATASALDVEEWAWFARIYVDGDLHASLEVRPGETRDLTDLAASLAAGGTIEIRFALELGTK